MCKKLLIVAMLSLGISGCALSSNNTCVVNDTSINDIDTSYRKIRNKEFCKDLGYMIDTGRRIKATYEFLNGNLDYILTTKGAVKTLVLLTPFFMVYCRYFHTSLFDSDPIQDLVNRIIQSIGRAEELYAIQKEIGKSQAFWGTISTQPWHFFCMAANKTVDTLIYSGLPFMSGMLFKLGIGSK